MIWRGLARALVEGAVDFGKCSGRVGEKAGRCVPGSVGNAAAAVVEVVVCVAVRPDGPGS